MAEMDTKKLSDTRIAIIGLGLMGGSLAMALHGKCKRLLGVDPNPEIRALADEMGIADQIFELPQQAIPKAELVILAAPVRKIIRLIEQLPEMHPGSAIVMDIGSTKAVIMAAMAALPDRFDPIGGHPMAGKERASLLNAEAELYRGATFVLTALDRSSSQARGLALEIVQAVGAVPLWLTADIHDHWVSATSHLPYLVSNALAAVTPLEAVPLVGPGFRSTARLAPSTLEMMLDILATNRSNLLANVACYRQRIEALEAALEAEDSQGITRLLIEGSDSYNNLVRHQEGH